MRHLTPGVSALTHRQDCGWRNRFRAAPEGTVTEEIRGADTRGRLFCPAQGKAGQNKLERPVLKGSHRSAIAPVKQAYTAMPYTYGFQI